MPLDAKNESPKPWVGLQVQCDRQDCKTIHVLKAGDDVRKGARWLGSKRKYVFNCKACSHRIEFGVA